MDGMGIQFRVILQGPQPLRQLRGQGAETHRCIGLARAQAKPGAAAAILRQHDQTARLAAETLERQELRLRRFQRGDRRSRFFFEKGDQCVFGGGFRRFDRLGHGRHFSVNDC